MYNVYEEAAVWKLLEDAAEEELELKADASCDEYPGCRDANSSANDSPCLIIVQWMRTVSGWGFITNWRKSEAFGI